MIHPSTEPSQPIYCHARIVGHVRGTTFHKTMRGSVHMLRTPRGWASDVAALEDAQQAGATYLQITDIETGAMYRASIGYMLAHGYRFDRGYGPQIALPIERWARPDQAYQPSLF